MHIAGFLRREIHVETLSHLPLFFLSRVPGCPDRGARLGADGALAGGGGVDHSGAFSVVKRWALLLNALDIGYSIATMKTLKLTLRKEVNRLVRFRARRGVGSLSILMQAPPVAKLVKGLGGIRPAARASNLGTDTVYRLLKGQGTLRSLERVAEAAGYRLQLIEPKASVWGVLHSSRAHDWQTPAEVWQDLLQRLNVSAFTLDPCSPGPDSPIPCRNRYTMHDDGLTQPWGSARDLVWLNPPYGREIRYWMEKAVREARSGVRIVALVPARTGARWWHDALDAGAIPEFLRGRLTFIRPNGEKTAPAPFDSALLFFGFPEGMPPPSGESRASRAEVPMPEVNMEKTGI
jgi:site-specific DNA-methyltransferase (adenine-specific)